MCSRSPAKRRRIDRWWSRTQAAALVLACLCCPCLAAERPPSWLTELASGQVPEYDSEVGAVVLLNEHTVTVEPDGKVTTSVRKAIKVLTREGRREARGDCCRSPDTTSRPTTSSTEAPTCSNGT